MGIAITSELPFLFTCSNFGGILVTYISEIRELLTACDVRPTIYERKPTRVSGNIHPLTPKQRRKVDELSIERGYRRFVAERMVNI